MGVGSIQPFLSRTMEAYPMQGKVREQWMKLCEQAAVEQDPETLIQLVQEIDRMLGEKEDRLLRQRNQVPTNRADSAQELSSPTSYFVTCLDCCFAI